MNRTEENQELIDKVNRCFDSIEHANALEVAGIRDALNLFIRLDISRSLAVIADKLTEEAECRRENRTNTK